ncbi:RNA-directed DNA polymerase [Azospirillum sp. B21]|nr:RNA-directed DNA polymerase [Azospirillum sp. B21]
MAAAGRWTRTGYEVVLARGKTIFRDLTARGAKPDAAQQVAANSRRWGRNSGKLLNAVLTIGWADQLGLPRLA